MRHGGVRGGGFCGRGQGFRGGRGRGGRGRGRGAGGRRPHPGRSRPNEQHLDEYDLQIETLGSRSESSLTIAIEGCGHGELDAIYGRLKRHEEKTGEKVDLLLCCGDFQSIRNMADFHSIAVPPKYRALGSFYRYFSGQTRAPILTLFIGGNHEASQPLHELFYGGWVAPNIYYMGAAGVVSYRGIRIGGISGIYKSHDYHLGRFEQPPYDRASLRSIYHVREAEVYRLKAFAKSCQELDPQKPPVDIMLSHDWPRGIEQYGDTQGLVRRKPFFKSEIEQNCLGSPPNEELLGAMKARYWFSAHLHVKFKASFSHEARKRVETKPAASEQLTPSQVITASQPSSTKQSEGTDSTEFVALSSRDPCAGPDLTDLMTQFLSLDKCLPRRHFLSILYLEPRDDKAVSASARLHHDPTWLAVLRKTHSLSSTSRGRCSVPTETQSVSLAEVQELQERESWTIDPDEFVPTVPAHQGPPFPLPREMPSPLGQMGHPQTDKLLRRLGLDHILTVPYDNSKGREGANHGDENPGNHEDENAIDIDDENNGDDNAIDIDDENNGDDNEIDIDDENNVDDNEIDIDVDENEKDIDIGARTEGKPIPDESRVRATSEVSDGNAVDANGEVSVQTGTAQNKRPRFDR